LKFGIILYEENKKELMKKSREKVLSELEIKYVIMDCSCMNYVDSQGVNEILNVTYIFLFALFYLIATSIEYFS
jgi:hypothetical protein